MHKSLGHGDRVEVVVARIDLASRGGNDGLVCVLDSGQLVASVDKSLPRAPYVAASSMRFARMSHVGPSA